MNHPDDPFDIKALRIDPATFATPPVPAKIRKRREQFIKLPMWWLEKLGEAPLATGATHQVASYLLHLHWKNRGKPFKLPNGMLKYDGISRQSFLERGIRYILGEGIGVSRDKDQLEYLVNSQTRQIGELQDKVGRSLDWSNGGDAGVALPSLVRIVGDGAASTRQRLKAASAILAFQVQDDGVVEFTKRYLESVCTSTDIGNIDHKVEAAELLRRHEAPRIAPETVRPTYREAEPTEPPEPLMQLVARRKARQEQREREAIERLEREAIPSERPQLLALLASRRNGNDSDGTPDS